MGCHIPGAIARSSLRGRLRLKPLTLPSSTPPQRRPLTLFPSRRAEAQFYHRQQLQLHSIPTFHRNAIIRRTSPQQCYYKD